MFFTGKFVDVTHVARDVGVVPFDVTTVRIVSVDVIGVRVVSL